MYFGLTLNHKPASDLGFLLHKNPSRLHEVELPFGNALIGFPQVDEETCTAVLFVDIDPVRLVRGRRPGGGDPYVNDRPYTANSFLSSALAKVFGTAMTGRSKERQGLADAELPFVVHLPALPCRGGERLLRKLFEPLGYRVEANQILLDPMFPEWGLSSYWDATFSSNKKLSDLLSHFYVLIPVLDDAKHHWIDRGEVEKLMRRGNDWLPSHPMKAEIAKRYLRRQHVLVNEALSRLAESEGVISEIDQMELAEADNETSAKEDPGPSLHQQRLDRVLAILQSANVHSVLDLGCGEGKLLKSLLKDSQFKRVVGMDVSWVALERAKRRMNLDRIPARVAAKLELLHGSLTYRDRRLEGFDAAAVVEVVEHLDPHRLNAFERSVFEFARPGIIVLTTPNREYNALFEGLPEGKLRHADHRFEWTRAEFQDWSTRVANAHGYRVRVEPVGTEHEVHGAPSQLAVFERVEPTVIPLAEPGARSAHRSSAQAAAELSDKGEADDEN